MVALKSPDECADLLLANETLGLKSGVLIAVPIPEEHAQDSKLVCNVWVYSFVFALKCLSH